MTTSMAIPKPSANPGGLFVGVRRVKRPVLVIAACLACLAGVGLARYWPASNFVWLVPVAVGVLFSLRRHNMVTLLCLAVFMFGIGWWRGSVASAQLAQYKHLALHKVVIVGRAADDAVYGQRSQLTFGLDHASVLSHDNVALPGSLKISGFGANSIYRGDVVRVSGKLYPTRGNSQASVSFASLEVLERNTSTIDSLRRKFAAGLQSALPEPLASFGLGLLVGQRSTLPDSVAHDLQVAGLTHIIAVSGYNLTIMVEASRRLLGKRSKFQTAAACVLLIVTFLLITGYSPSIVRASIISMLSIAAWYYGRKIKPLVIILLAAVISVLANPLYLWGNVGWYLSFLAFFGVLVLAPLVTKRLLGSKEPKLLVQIAIESVCAEVMALPYILYIFGHISMMGLVANVLVVALIPAAMLLCVVAGLAGTILPLLAGWFAWPAKLLLTYMLDVAALLGRVPFALLEHIQFSLAMLLTYYALIGLLIVVLRSKVSYKHDIITDKQEEQSGSERTFQVVDN